MKHDSMSALYIRNESEISSTLILTDVLVEDSLVSFKYNFLNLTSFIFVDDTYFTQLKFLIEDPFVKKKLLSCLK